MTGWDDFPGEWVTEAACAGHFGDLWFADLGHWRDTQQAKRICRTCPVRSECLDYALPRREYGVWGGMTAGERSELRRKRGIVNQTPAADGDDVPAIPPELRLVNRKPAHWCPGKDACQQCRANRARNLKEAK